MEHPKTTLTDLPRDVLSKIIGKVGEESREDVKSCIQTCKDLEESASDYQVFKTLELRMLQRHPLRAVGNYSDLMDKCLLHANPAAQYVQGVLEYFHYDNPLEGLYFLKEAANAPVPIDEAVYLYGMIKLCTGQFEIGKIYIDHLDWENDKSLAEECWANIKTALHGIGIIRKPEYFNSLWTMLPPWFCNINDMQNTCEKCYH